MFLKGHRSWGEQSQHIQYLYPQEAILNNLHPPNQSSAFILVLHNYTSRNSKGCIMVGITVLLFSPTESFHWSCSLHLPRGSAAGHRTARARWVFGYNWTRWTKLLNHSYSSLPGIPALSFAAALIHNPLVRFTIKPHIYMPLTPFSVELQNRTDAKLYSGTKPSKLSSKQPSWFSSLKVAIKSTLLASHSYTSWNTLFEMGLFQKESLINFS